MNLLFEAPLALSYRSPLQKIRVLSEGWVSREVYCPACGKTNLEKYSNNSRVADFFCDRCHENFELKSQSREFGRKIVDGAYGTMIERLSATTNPNLLLLRYDQKIMAVLSLTVVPKHMFIPALIEKRKPLASTARRAGWVGCNISLADIPQVGRILLIKDRIPRPQKEVIAQWNRAVFLRNFDNPERKGWLLSVMKCIDTVGKSTFTLEDLYRHENYFKSSFPSNQHIQPKIRQQLQVLRDKGYLEFLGKGVYRLTSPDAPPKREG